ncbi:MAG: type III pantothenate kinase [Vicingaceae bacterium]|nr:MAG: type III pantothenate kinase [Vicingaceae bacterium]
MKTLCIDFGNTRIKWAVFQNDQPLGKVFDCEYDIEKFSKKISNASFDKTIYASVKKDSEIMPFLKKINTSSESKSIKDLQKFNFTSDYDLSQIGQDRMAVIAAGVEAYPNRPLLLIDAGTCITYDFVNEKNHHLGGMISPGITMRAKSFPAFTSNLPDISGKIGDLTYSFPAKNTFQALWLGSVYSAVLEATKMTDEFFRQYPDGICVISGGDSKYFENHLKNAIFAPANFLLKGIYALFKLNEF